MSTPETRKSIICSMVCRGPDAGRDKIIRSVPDTVAGRCPAERKDKRITSRTGRDLSMDSYPVFESKSAGGGTRTLMPSRAPDFESSASAISPLRHAVACFRGKTAQ